MALAQVSCSAGQGGFSTMLSGLSDADLKELCRRISKSREDLDKAFVDLQTEQQDLKEENVQLQGTIALMMKEMRRLNIRAVNLTEPQLDEGPIDFVARIWEKVRPRDAAVRTSMHVGELRKAAAPGDASPVRRVKEQLREQLAQRLAGLSAAVEQVAGGATARPQEAGGESAARPGQTLKDRVNERFFGAGAPQSEVEASPRGGATPGAGASISSLFAYLRTPSQRQELGPDSSGPEDAEDVSAALHRRGAAAPGAGAGEKEGGGGCSTSAGSGSGPGSKAASEAVSREGSDDLGAAAGAAAAAGARAAAAAEGEPDSTLLIEVRLTLGDGSVELVRVRAAERCKEVAARFVREHCLKAWFEEPLRAFLMEVEANAETFPARLEADLLDIRRRFPPKKA